ncbi:MAG: PKD domain-containing protein [Xanthomonadales bacterium]|nr:PKD domain-containing protein [Xanthomonadales bacterium]
MAAAQTTHQWPSGTGFPNVPRTAGERLAGPFATADGRMALFAWLNGVLFSIPEGPSSLPGSNLQVRIWNLSNPADPRRIALAPAGSQGELGESLNPINAHGFFFLGQRMSDGQPGHYLAIGHDLDSATGRVWSFRATAGVPGIARQRSFHLGAATRGDVFQPWFVGPTFTEYLANPGRVELRFGGNGWNPGSQLLAEWDHLAQTGVFGHPFILGNLLIYAADQGRSGVATYDISDPRNPVLLDVLRLGGPGGYWPELWGHDGELYLVFPYNDNGNGFRVVDATDPSALRFAADVPLFRPPDSSGAMYAKFQDEYGFIGDHKVDMRTRQSVLRFTTTDASLPAAQRVDISQFALPLGNLIVTGGQGIYQGMAIFAHQAAPDTRPPSVAFHIPRAGQTHYPRRAPISVIIHETLDVLSIANGSSLMLRQVLGPGSYGPPLAGKWVLSFDDILTFTPDAELAANATYEFRLSGIRDAAGNAMPTYAFSFSTGGAGGGNRPPVVGSFSASPYPAAPGAAVSFGATASDPDGDVLQYRFDFGDGSPKTAWSASPSASHAYAREGHFRAVVQVRDPSGVIASASRVVTVLAPLSGPRPTASGQMVCASAARRVYTVHPDHDRVSVFDADTLSRLAEYPVCDHPSAIALRAGSPAELWIACRDDDRVEVRRADNGTLLGAITLEYGSAPVAVVLSPDGGRAFVALEGRRELRRYAAATRAETGRLALPAAPRALAVSADGQSLFATRFLSPRNHAELWRIDAAAASLALAETRRIGKFGGERHRDTPSSGRGVANQLAAVAVSPRDGRLAVAATKPNFERGRLIHPSRDLTQDNTVRALLMVVAPTGAPTLRRDVDIDNADSPAALAFSPLGDYLLVALQGSNEVAVLDALALEEQTGFGASVLRREVGLAPQGLCVDEVTGRTFVHDFLGRTLSILETQPLWTAGSTQMARETRPALSVEPLPPPVLEGKRIFYNARDPRMSAEGYLSCATCHLDGDHDGRTWDFTGRGEGLRNTPSLRGRGGMAHGNVHWSANFDEIQDFEGDIRQFFGGRGFLTDAQFAATQHPLGPPKAGLSAALDALAAYVGSLGPASLPRSPFRNPDGSLGSAAQRGQAVFEAQGCGSCHAPPRYTNSGTGAAPPLADVGTLRPTSGSRLGGPLTGIDTPSLLGLFATAPYFHDGSAPALEDVFRVTGGILVPAEQAQRYGGARLVDQFTELNEDDTPRGRAFVALEGSGQGIRLVNVHGGSGGPAALELRFSNSRPLGSSIGLRVRVNGSLWQTVSLPGVGNDPNWRVTNWEQVWIEGFSLAAGSGNTIELEATDWMIALDEVLIANRDRLQQAQPHRRVLALAPGDRADLIAFLLSLDRSSAGGAGPPPGAIFADGFE